MTTSGLIAANPYLGWEGIFYFHGGLSMIWCILWAVLVFDTPLEHPYASEDEKEYIKSNQPNRAPKDVRNANLNR